MGKLISKVQKEKEKAMKSQIQFFCLGVWKPEASLAGIMEMICEGKGRTGRSLGKWGKAGLQGSGHCDMSQSAERLIDLLPQA